MSIFNFSILEKINLKDRVFEYFLKKYLGEFLLDSTQLRNAHLTISEGRLCGQLDNVDLDSEALNARFSNTQYNADKVAAMMASDASANLNLPIIFMQHVRVGQIRAEVPWSKLMAENSIVEIDGINVELRLNMLEKRSTRSAEEIMVSSMDFDLMSPSMQIAEELLNEQQMQDEQSQSEQKGEKRLDGLEMLANVIESVLRRIELTLTNITFGLVDENCTSKLEFRIRRSVWCRPEGDNRPAATTEDNQQRSSAEPTTATTPTAAAEDDQRKEDSENFTRIMKITGLEAWLDGKRIALLEKEQEIKLNFGKTKSIQVILNSILAIILTPSQLRCILKVFAPPDNSVFIDPRQINFRDLLNQRLITEEDYKKIEKQIQLEKSIGVRLKDTNKHNLHQQLNQIWTCGFENEKQDEEETFYPFTKPKVNQDIDSSQASAKNASIDLFIELPALVFCLLDNRQGLIEATESACEPTLESINRYLDKLLEHENGNSKDHLRIITIGNSVALKKESISCAITHLMLSECAVGQFEQILFSESINQQKIEKNYLLQYDPELNKLNLQANLPTYCNIDLTFIERLSRYLYIDEATSIFDVSAGPEDENAIRLDKSKFSSAYEEGSANENDQQQFTCDLNFGDLKGRLFFPIPVFTEVKKLKTFSEVRDETLELNTKNTSITIDSKKLSVVSDFATLHLNQNYQKYKRANNIKYMHRNLFHINASLATFDEHVFSGDEICQLRSLNHLNRIELTINFGAAATDQFLENAQFSQANSSSAKQKSATFFSENMEDSVYINNCFNLDKIQLSEFQTKRRIVKEKHNMEEILAPNNRQQSSDYLNAASLVSELVVQFSMPQMIAILTSQQQLNIMYNRFANDLAFWKPFNVHEKYDTGDKQPAAEDAAITGNLFKNSDQEFIQFDQNISKLLQSQTQSKNLMECSTVDMDGWDPNINISSHEDDDFHHFEVSDKLHSLPPKKPALKKDGKQGGRSSYYLCRSGLEESTDSEISFHSFSETVPEKHNTTLANGVTFILKVKEAVLSLEIPSKEPIVQPDHQSIIGSSLLIGCVINMSEFNNANRIFIHGDEMNHCMNNLGPLTKTQAYSAQNQQYYLLTANRLFNQSRNCKFNAGIEIVFEEPTVKKIKIVIQLVDGMLLQINTDQIIKFWDFINVTDEELEGYVPPKINTELHVNLLNSAILIEPECICNNINHHLLMQGDPDLAGSLPCHDCENPFQLIHRPALFFCEDTSIKCIVSEDTQETYLRFIFEETALFFIKKIPDYSTIELDSKVKYIQPLDNFQQFSNVNKNLLQNLLSIDNYVCTISCDFLELNLTLSKGSLCKICINNNLINIRGCSDSLAALFCFFHRFNSSSGAEQEERCRSDSGVQSPPASKQSESEKPIYDERMLEDEEVDHKPAKDFQCKCGPSSLKSMSAAKDMDESSFFILGDDDFGQGIKRSPEPEVRSLADEMNINDVYFSAPKESSTPCFTDEQISRFLLDHMSICLHLYGGRDFYENFKKISSRASAFANKEGFEKTSSKSKAGGVRFKDNFVLECMDRQNEKNQRRYSKFDMVALNFGRSLDFYWNTGFNDNSNALSEMLWEDLDLTQAETPNSYSTQRPTSMGTVKTASGYSRNNSLYVKIFLLKMRCMFDRYAETCPINWKFLFSVNELEIRDCVKNSQINKMLYEYVSDRVPKRSNNMLTIHTTTFRTLLCDKKVDKTGLMHDRSEHPHGTNKKMYDLNSDECDLKISLKPLRINIDQDTIMYLIEYFNQLSLYMEHASLDAAAPQTGSLDDVSSTKSTSNSELNNLPEHDTSSIKSSNSTSTSASSRDPNHKPLFVKSFVFSPDVPIKLDYQGKRVDLDQGPVTGILMGLGQLNQSELTLKKIHYKYGILGFEKVLLHALNVWMSDIKKHQLPSILGGVGPVHTFVQLFQGIRDLFWLPIDQYRKDRRIVRGLQRGLFSFSTCSTIALLELTNKTLSIIEFAAQSAHDFMTVNSLRRERMLSAKYEKNLRAQQPRDVREGALSAYNVISEGFYQAFRNLTVGRSRHNSSTIGHIIRELPANVLLPIIHSSQATSNVLLGVRNQMTPQARKEDEDKWKS